MPIHLSILMEATDEAGGVAFSSRTPVPADLLARLLALCVSGPAVSVPSAPPLNVPPAPPLPPPPATVAVPTVAAALPSFSLVETNPDVLDTFGVTKMDYRGQSSRPHLEDGQMVFHARRTQPVGGGAKPEPMNGTVFSGDD